MFYTVHYTQGDARFARPLENINRALEVSLEIVNRGGIINQIAPSTEQEIKLFNFHPALGLNAEK